MRRSLGATCGRPLQAFGAVSVSSALDATFSGQQNPPNLCHSAVSPVYADGDYSLIVEPVEGEQQIFSEPEKANWALIEWMVKSAHANDRYFTLAEDG
jgi:hypothetical protein